MLRALALALLLANAVLLAAQFGVFERLMGPAPAAQREPERLQRQVNPEGLRILSPQAASAALAAAAASAAQASAAASSALLPACLEAGPFVGADAEAAERTLRDAGLAAASWQALRSEDGGAFMVYMGRYADRETLQRKQEEVRRRKVEVEEIRGAPELQPGLSLGRFSSKAAADTALAAMGRRGVRSARVITLRPAQSHTVLRVPAADAAQRARLAGLRLPSGPGFVACGAPANGAASAPAGATPPAAAPAATAPVAAAASVAPAAPAPAAAPATAPAAAASPRR